MKPLWSMASAGARVLPTTGVHPGMEPTGRTPASSGLPHPTMQAPAPQPESEAPSAGAWERDRSTPRVAHSCQLLTPHSLSDLEGSSCSERMWVMGFP